MTAPAMTTGPCASLAARRASQSAPRPSSGSPPRGRRRTSWGASVNSALAYLAPSASHHRRDVATPALRSRAAGRSGSAPGRMAGYGRVLAWPPRCLELKRSRGGQLSPAQRALHPRLEAAGFPVAVVRCARGARCGGGGGIPSRKSCRMSLFRALAFTAVAWAWRSRAHGGGGGICFGRDVMTTTSTGY